MKPFYHIALIKDYISMNYSILKLEFRYIISLKFRLSFSIKVKNWEHARHMFITRRTRPEFFSYSWWSSSFYTLVRLCPILDLLALFDIDFPYHSGLSFVSNCYVLGRSLIKINYWILLLLLVWNKVQSIKLIIINTLIKKM